MKIKYYLIGILLFTLGFTQEVNLYRVNIEGNTTTSDKMIKYSAGLRDGTKIQRADISTALTRLWDLNLFDDIDIVLNNESQYGVEITINVVESPTLNNIIFRGNSMREGRFLDKLDLKLGQRIRPSSLYASSNKIKEIYQEDGYFNVEVAPSIEAPQDTLVRNAYAKDVVFTIQENEKFRLRNITFEGNTNFSERKLKKELKETKERKWYNFWVKSFNDKLLEEDKALLTTFYQNEGYRDFNVIKDTLVVDEKNNSLNLDAEFNLQISFFEALNGTKKNLLVNDERIEVKIPKGIETGSKIRIKNKGNIQSGKGKRGDLLIKVSINSHPIWKVKGLDVYADLPISLDELALGANISVASPQGDTYLSIPSGSLPEQKLRLKGQGLHNLDTQGDLFFILKLKFPENWSDEELRLLEKLRSVRIDEPRSSWFDQART